MSAPMTTIRPITGSLAITFAVIIAAVLIALALPRPVVACSCVPPDMILDGAANQPDTAVFTAVVGPSIGNQVNLAVTRWFRGAAPAAFVVAGVDVGSSASCGMAPPPPGNAYLFAMPLEAGRGGLNLCSLMADLATPDGAAMLARATALFGPGVAAATDAPAATDPPAPTDAPPPTDSPADATSTSIIGAAAPLVVVIVFALGLIVGVTAVLRRRRDA
ncbi:hypothetical protein BH20CHL7_BH20CHL7_10150 [soil metagenome]